ncbi:MULTISPECIES: vanadium-dependent haloperoxidase [unclassified Streptomyces]|uniref:vanadium-dependent haloperoxidase n=1 Tax=unclassified Streptomyces TaxID=2593676 RepID=UPI002DDA103A|nr:vanadium-dependent haloperoxidase [Streptomyces sp. NBC_01761]WSC54672.1 vanadium-dependent haloperoxidase [Streptomyces sp. NBC_01761]WSF85509.1 vanadium-dependent haloperoxidase [Streptomyces sp. NBC_01744]
MGQHHPFSFRRSCSSRSSRSGLRATIGAIALLALVALMVPAGPTAAADHRQPPSADPAAIRDWNAIATETISANLGPTRPSGQVAVWHGFVSAAVYNAVVGIQGNYAPYKWRESGPATASPEASAVTAAHHILLALFPASQAQLDTAYAASLAEIPSGPAKDQGVAFGARAAAHIIDLREGDGRFVDVPFTKPPAPGVWRPTPPARLPFIDTWLGRLRPLLLTSPAQFRPGEPPALSSARYARDANEVKTMGVRTGSGRTAHQTETALFYGGNLMVQIQTALRDHAARHHLGIAETARLFAAANTSATDAVITAWDSKLRYGVWRPITAIQLADSDGNPATEADPLWEPLLITPPHPEYVSGHTALTGAVMRVVTGVLGTSRVDLDVTSEVTGTTRHYEYADQLNEDMINARVYGGIHFRTSDVTGCLAGNRIGTWALAHYFQPLRTGNAQASQTARPAQPKCPRGGAGNAS